ncbi:MFS transporter [Fructilactobacillus florum]|uniref:Major facilitator superfamily protein n=1 Tax=Fructilactobacillus florum DSM 22689 = JCM 16035 TaxID=1423745 RepID=A0A0R2CL25_9LACO|nr:MFS transporter [Fructilactobacillus florum]KRM92349.1 major facilitator superfamily protein [Fructilactobacillus florum DSM 22689 = JCM 16035]
MSTQVTLQTKLTILATALLAFSGILLETSMNVTFPELAQLFHLSLGTIQWLTTGYLLVVTIIMATTAFLLKRFALRNLFITAVAIFLIGDLFSGLAPNFTILLLGRLIQAAATGLAMPMMYQVIFTKVPQAKIGLYTGIASMVISLAPALGPTYGGLLSSLFSWREIFLWVLPIVIVGLVLGWAFIDIPAAGTNKHFDFGALFFLSCGLLSFVWAATQFGNLQASLLTKFLPLLGGIAAFAIFVYLNQHGSSEVLSLNILKHLPVRLDALNYFILMFINIGISFVIPIYAEGVLKVTPLVAGLILLPGSIIGGFLAPVAGWIYDRFGAFVPIISGLVIVVISTALFGILQAVFTPLVMLLLFTSTRIGFNLAFSNTISNAHGNVPHEQSADVNSLFNMLQQYAGSLGTSILASIIALKQTTADSSTALIQQTYRGGHLDFMLLCGLALIALVAAIINYWEQKHRGTAL